VSSVKSSLLAAFRGIYPLHTKQSAGDIICAGGSIIILFYFIYLFYLFIYDTAFPSLPPSLPPDYSPLPSAPASAAGPSPSSPSSTVGKSVCFTRGGNTCMLTSLRDERSPWRCCPFLWALS